MLSVLLPSSKTTDEVLVFPILYANDQSHFPRSKASSHLSLILSTKHQEPTSDQSSDCPDSLLNSYMMDLAARTRSGLLYQLHYVDTNITIAHKFVVNARRTCTGLHTRRFKPTKQSSTAKIWLALRCRQKVQAQKRKASRQRQSSGRRTVVTKPRSPRLRGLSFVRKLSDRQIDVAI